MSRNAGIGFGILVLLSCRIGPAFQDESKLVIEGKWRVVAAEYKGKSSPFEEEDNIIWEIKKEEIVETSPGFVGKNKYSIDATLSPMTIDISGTTSDSVRVNWRGIIRMDGGNIQICARAAYKGKIPIRPSEFSTKGSDPDLKMWLFSRDTSKPDVNE